MSDVVLINPRAKNRTKRTSHVINGCVPSIGLGYLSAYLEKAGETVHIVDANAELLSDDQVIERIHSYSAKHVGITAMTVQVNPALDLADSIKNKFPETLITFGGVHATTDPEYILCRDAVDFVFRGEGEENYLSLLQEMSVKDIPGLSYKMNNDFIHNELALPISDIDLVSMPAYHLMPMEFYRPSIGNYKRLPGIGIIGSRGCPGKCTFCFVGTNGTRTRFRSPKSVFEEVKLLHDQYGMREIAFYDDNFTTSKKIVREFCNLLLKSNVDVTWTCASRVDTVDKDILELMKESGCHSISYGVETGDPWIMENIKKKISLDRAKQTIKVTEDVGIDAKVYLMLGHQGETQASMEKTYQFAMETDPSEIIVSIVTPYPGTELHRWAKEFGYLREISFDDYDVSLGGILELPTISTSEIIKFYKKFRFRFYFRLSYILRRLRRIRSWRDLQRDFIAALNILGIIY
jgi:anaerobic magnesium-protoporphyrin IX monomethyl ester cyclase